MEMGVFREQFLKNALNLLIKGAHFQSQQL